MSNELLLGVIIILSGVVIAQQINIHGLVNKLMSHNYRDYQQSKVIPEQSLTSRPVNLDDSPLESFNEMSDRVTL